MFIKCFVSLYKCTTAANSQAFMMQIKFLSEAGCGRGQSLVGVQEKLIGQRRGWVVLVSLSLRDDKGLCHKVGSGLGAHIMLRYD